MYLTRHPAEGPPQRFTQSVTGSVFPPPLPRSKAGNVGYPLSLRLPPIIQPMADSSPKVLPSPSSQSMWLPWQQRSPPFSLPWALSAGGDMLTSLLPEERSSPLTSSSCLLPALFPRLSRGEGLSAGRVYPRLPQPIILHSFPWQPFWAHQGRWRRLPDPTARLPLPSYPWPLMPGASPGDRTPLTSSTPISWDISLSPLFPSSRGSLLPLPAALSVSLQGLGNQPPSLPSRVVLREAPIPLKKSLPASPWGPHQMGLRVPPLGAPHPPPGGGLREVKVCTRFLSTSQHGGLGGRALVAEGRMDRQTEGRTGDLFLLLPSLTLPPFSPPVFSLLI